MSKVFIRKSKESKPVVAICYDFDKTLSPDDMQAQGYIQSVGDEVESFWKESNGLAEENEMDQNLAYMFTMIRKAHGKVLFTKKALMDYGAKVQLFPGVETWFKRIRDYGVDKGVIVEHYIISSGLKEMIEGTKVANEFEKIYASSFYYDKDGVAQWPAQVITYRREMAQLVLGMVTASVLQLILPFLTQSLVDTGIAFSPWTLFPSFIILTILPFFIFNENKKTPAYVQYLGKYLPSAVFGMLVIYCLKNVSILRGSHGIPELISIIITGVLHIWKRNMLISIAGGTICYMLLIHFIFTAI